MAWTIACYCGNVYTDPPCRCEICGSTLEPSPSSDPEQDDYGQPVDLRDVDLDAVLTFARGQATPGFDGIAVPGSCAYDLSHR